MDIVYIKDLCIETIIGVYDWERKVKQTVCLNLEMAYDISKAVATDNIQYALDYEKIAQRLVDFVQQSDCFLVERLADESARIVIEEFNVPWLRLRLSKPEVVRFSKDVGIIIERGIRPAEV